MAYGYNEIGNQIDSLLGSGNEAQAWAMFNGLSGMGDAGSAAGGVAGNLDSYLRTRWGDDRAKQWVNSMDTKYGNTLFDPKTGQWAGMGQAAGQSGTIAGWNPGDYNAKGMGIAGAGYTPSGYGSGAEGFAGYTGVGVGSDGKPMPELGTAVDRARAGLPTGGGGAGVTGGAGDYGGGWEYESDGPPEAGGGAWAMPQRGAGAGTPFDFLNEAGLKFRLGQGMDQIENSAAARGGLLSGQTGEELEKFRQDVSSEEYGKAFDRYTNARDFGEDQFRSDRGFGRDVYESDRGFGEGQFRDRRDFSRGVYTDDRDFGENRRRYDQGFGEDRRRYDQGFEEGQFRDRRDFAVDEDRYNSDQDYRRAIDDRDFRENARRYDQGFDYTARTGDRAFDAQIRELLSRQGLTGSQGNANLQDSLARMIMQSMMQGAGAGAQGNMGGSQNWMDLIASLFGQGGRP